MEKVIFWKNNQIRNFQNQSDMNINQNYSNTYTYKDRNQRKYNNEINLYNYQTERSINRRRYPRNYHIEHKENYHQTGNYKFNYISCISKMHREC